MISRRLPIVLVVIAALAGVVLIGRDRPEPATAVFTRLPAPSMPFVPSGAFITGSWFCPGVPANGDPGVGGQFTITNPSDRVLQGRITLYNTTTALAPITDPFTVAARSSVSIDATAKITADFVSALVEIDGGGGIVEQRAVHPAGDSIAPCSNAASSTWYFADGFTMDGSTETIVITNPYPDAAVVNVSFVTDAGTRPPAALQGRPIPGRSVLAIPIAEFGARDEPILAVEITAERNRVVAGRSQHYLGSGRLGYTMTLGAPSLNEQWYFAEGGKGPELSERFTIFNPTDEDVDVDVVFLGVPLSPSFTNNLVVTVPDGDAVTVDAADVPGLPDGRHAAVFSTLSARSIVVERALTHGSGSGASTSVVMGAPPTHASTRWHVPSGVAQATPDALVVYNVAAVDATVTVAAIGPLGELPLPGYEAITAPASGVLPITIEDASSVGDPLVITSTERVYVERALGGALGSTSFGLPQ